MYTGEAVVLNILQRYVSSEVLRAFLMSLLTMTAIFVLFMIAAEAMRSRLLTPGDIAHLIPYVIPSTLPYTMPVSLLFAVTVVYGRIAGLSVMTMIWPTLFLAVLISGFLLYISRGWIPRSAHNAKLVLFKDLEDTFYKFLRRDKEFNNSHWPFLIKVREVQGRDMIDATFNKRAKNKDNTDTYSMTIQAKHAQLHFDEKAKVVRVRLDQAEIVNYGKGKDDDVALINRNVLEMPIPRDSQFSMEKSIQEIPNDEIERELLKAQHKIATDRKQQAIAVGFQFAAGRLDDIKWGEVQRAFVEHAYWRSRVNQFETEKQQRTSMAFGSLLFVILGAPVGILFAKRDFLSAFMSCFVPIITLYYPLILFGINMGKEGSMEPIKALWIGNVVLIALSVWVYPKIIKY
jgi:lipopolysaccharide export system permease protein